MSRVHEITDFAIRVAREAGQIAMAGFRDPGLEVSAKHSIHDVVTLLDRTCEEHICREILAAYPDSSIVGEEGGRSEGDGTLTWYIDPIDGTSNFARGIAMWAVSIGIAQDGEIISGVVFDPVADQLFWADDRGAFLADHQGRTQPIRSTGALQPAQATVAMNFPLPRDLVHLPDLALEQFARVTREFAQVRMLGSTCITLCWIAAGWIDATVSFETNPWDVAAAGFIVQQAGGTYLGFRDGEAQPARGDHLQPHYYAAVPGANYPTLLEIMRIQSARPL
ncbi:inositol monophosphatase family protein [Leucobacter sp. W1153]|uniref:inositol monophosphatase family protein n=1 Tax=Leucobacter sp. W1153 TaxID=3439064 RepID=UPI003F3F7314